MAAATGGLAVFVLPMSALSERFGRRTVMTASLAVAVTVGLLVPFAPSLTALVVLRAVQGAALAGLPASATAYLAEARVDARIGAGHRGSVLAPVARQQIDGSGGPRPATSHTTAPAPVASSSLRTSSHSPVTSSRVTGPTSVSTAGVMASTIGRPGRRA
ncbi:hypothetical protein SALBM311S_00712 [Streptomyces alboniger]